MPVCIVDRLDRAGTDLRGQLLPELVIAAHVVIPDGLMEVGRQSRDFAVVRGGRRDGCGRCARAGGVVRVPGRASHARDCGKGRADEEERDPSPGDGRRSGAGSHRRFLSVLGDELIDRNDRRFGCLARHREGSGLLPGPTLYFSGRPR